MSLGKNIAVPNSLPTFVRLGPFYRLQRRLGLLSDAELRAGRRALLFIAVAWIPVLVLGGLESLGVGVRSQHTVFEDFSVYAFAIAIGAFVFMEQSSERRMAMLVGQLQKRGIVASECSAAFVGVVNRMERRTGSWLAEVLILLSAYLLTYAWIVSNALKLDGGTWMHRWSRAPFA